MTDGDMWRARLRLGAFWAFLAVVAGFALRCVYAFAWFVWRGFPDCGDGWWLRQAVFGFVLIALATLVGGFFFVLSTLDGYGEIARRARGPRGPREF